MNLQVKPSWPRAFAPQQDHTTTLISSTENGASNLLASVSEMDLKISFVSFGLEGHLSQNLFLENQKTPSFIALSSLFLTPLIKCPFIWFFLFLLLTKEWKNLVFSSLSIAYFIRDFCCRSHALIFSASTNF